MFSSALQPSRSLRPPRYNFVVSAITFEGFKLRSSNLTHAISHPNISDKFDNCHCRPIQNGLRRSFSQNNSNRNKFRIDLKWPEMGSKVIFGHPIWPLAVILSKSSVSIWKWIFDIQNGHRWPFCQKFPKKVPYRWNDIQITKIKIVYRSSETARNPIKNDFRISILSKIKKNDLKWREMRPKVIFEHPKWQPAAILQKKITKIKIVVSIWNGKKCDLKVIFDIQIGCWGLFFKKHLQTKLREWFEQCSNRLLVDYNLML